LTVPAEAVRRTGDRTEVFVVAADGTNAARAVRLGEKGEGHYEVLEGLAEGDKVLARPPEGGK
jgi:Cu(I)/Ag(I) efflux system membrane fusion protein